MPAYQRQYLIERIEKLRKALGTATGDHIAALEEVIAFWKEAIKTPYDTDNTRLWGKYVVVRTTHSVSSDEWTNIGVIIFDSEGKQIWAKMGPFDRAIRRGDLDIHDEQHTRGKELPKAYQTLEQVERALQSMGHAMSSIQITPPRATSVDIECCWSIYDDFILGL